MSSKSAGKPAPVQRGAPTEFEVTVMTLAKDSEPRPGMFFAAREEDGRLTVEPGGIHGPRRSKGGVSYRAGERSAARCGYFDQIGVQAPEQR